MKPPGTKRLKLKCDILLSTSAFNFNLRRCTMGAVVNLQGIVEELETKLQAAMKSPQGNGGRGRGLHSFPFLLNLSRV